MARQIGVVIIICFVSSVCLGDKVMFKNNDCLTGKIKQIADGKLIFESDLMGEVKTDFNNVQTFSTEKPVELHLRDGTVIKQNIKAGQPGTIEIEQIAILQAQKFHLADILTVKTKAEEPAKWHGDITAGLTSSHGNTSVENQNLSVNLHRRAEIDRWTISADYARSRQEDPDTGEKQVTEHWWRTKTKYDYFLTKKLFAYGLGRYEKDSIAELDRRVIAGGGAGYQWVESDDLNLSTTAGLVSLYEKYEDQTEGDSEISAELGVHFDSKFADKFKFINDTAYYPSIEKFSNYFLSSTTELRADITATIFSSFKVIFDYDATPAEDSGKTDVKYILGVGVKF